MSSHFSVSGFFESGIAPQSHSGHPHGGEPVKGLSEATLEGRGGFAPYLVQPVRGTRELDYSAQVTPAFRAVLQERKRADLVRRTKRKLRLYQKSQVARVLSAGMGRGLEFKTPITAAWDIAGQCLNPREFRMDAAASRLSGERLVRAPGRPYSVVLTVRCRACEWCLRQRAARWAFRAVEEIDAHVRTWFATFTFTPQNHVVMRAMTSRRLARGGTDFALLSATEQHVELSREYGAEITKYFKRIRKNSDAPLRYILVQEPHKSGLPHFHALIHEVDATRPIRHRTLSTGWKLGFSKFKLCEGSKTAWYVAKYLTKSAWTRVRASKWYGNIDALRRSKLKAPRENLPHQPPLPNETNELKKWYGVQPNRLKENENVFFKLQDHLSEHSSGLQPAEAGPGSSPLDAAKAVAQAISSHAIAAWSRATGIPYTLTHARPHPSPASRDGPRACPVPAASSAR